MTNSISFTVPGDPKALKRHRTTKSGHNYDPSAGDKADFMDKALRYRPDAPWEGPIRLTIICYFLRPKSHYKTGRKAGSIKQNVPCFHYQKPDLSNILKFIEDAFNSIFWRDDAQICDSHVIKQWSTTPKIEIHMEKIV
jgi:Holliday junction resolvase RusA-like endonuclease